MKKKKPVWLPNDEMEAENAVLKLRLETEFGMTPGLFNSDLSTEMINFFLKNVIAFEESYRQNKVISVFDYLGRPKYKPFVQLSQIQLNESVRTLRRLLHSKHILIEEEDEPNDLLFYRYVTEKLFHEEITPPPSPDFVIVFSTKSFYDEE